LQWIDAHFPEDGDPGYRRRALEQALEYFSDDPPTVFRAQVRLALLDWSAGQPKAADDRLTALLRSKGKRVDPDLVAWAETVDAVALGELGRTYEAADRLERVARDRRLPDGRRAAAAAACAEILLPKDSRDAISLLEETTLLPGGDTDVVEAALVHGLLYAGRRSELKSRLSVLANSGEPALVSLLRATRGWSLPGDADRLAELADGVSAVWPISSSAFRDALSAVRAQAASATIRERLLTLLSEPPLAGWFSPAQGDPDTRPTAFERSIGEAKRRGDPVSCLQLCLRALAASTDGDFPRRLWQAAAFADWIEREHRPIDGRVCSSLLDLCDRLPAGDEFNIEGKFLRAERCGRTGDRPGEQEALRQITALPDLPPRYLEPACRMLGSSLEAGGDPAGALEAYRPVESGGAGSGAAADCLLHAVFDNLELQNSAEAVRLVGVLGQAPDDVVAAATAPGQIRAFVQLIGAGGEGECWTAARQWWPAWETFAREVGIPAPGVPEIPDIDGLARQAEIAHRDGDREGFLRDYLLLASSARWLPSVAVQVGSLEADVGDFVPERRAEIRSLSIALLEAPHPAGIPGRRERQLLLAKDYFNADRPDDTLRVAADFFGESQARDGITRTMRELRALASLKAGRDFAPSAAGLEADLADRAYDGRRPTAVGLLADLYTRMGREADARALIESEVRTPALQANPAERAPLLSRLRSLRSAPASADPVSGWIKAANLRWLDYAGPASLDDPRLANLEDVLSDPGKAFGPIEQIKLNLLAAGDPARTEDQRRRSFREAARQILGTARDYRRLDDLAEPIVNNPAFDPETRAEILWTVLANLSEEGRQAEYDSWRRNPLCAGLADSFQEKLGVLDVEASVDRSSSAAILAAADRLGSRELSSYGALALQDMMEFLIRLGDLQAAEVLADRLPAWRFNPAASPGKDALQIDFDRRLRAARSSNPVHEALAASLLAHYREGPSELPPEYRDLRPLGPLAVRTPSATFAAALWYVHHRQFERDDFLFWGTVLQNLPRAPDTAEAVGDMLHAALASASDDRQRSELMVLFFSSADVDDPAVRSAIEREFAAYRDPAKYPSSHLVVRLYEIHRDLRLGLKVPLKTVFSDLSDPRVQVVREQACLRAYTEAGDRAELERLVDQIDPGRLVSAGFITRTIQAFECLGLKTEVASAKDVARGYLRETVLGSWATGDEQLGAEALDLAEAIGDPGALPAAWLADMGSGPGDPFFQDRVRLVQASLASDWAGMESAAAALNRDYPTRYAYYWYRGLALHRLGREREAARALDTFASHAKDELQYPEALRILAAIRGPAQARD
jgi:hypothetical protein